MNSASSSFHTTHTWLHGKVSIMWVKIHERIFSMSREVEDLLSNRLESQLSYWLNLVAETFSLRQFS